MKNVLVSEPERNSFTVVTCMMGTLNHLPIRRHAELLSWVRESLRPGGLFVFSSWNARCPYTSFLRFYTREEAEIIAQNSIAPAAVKELACDVGLELERVVPICFLPDECYYAWMGELDDSALFELDDHLASKLNPNDAQMFVAALRKSGSRRGTHAPPEHVGLAACTCRELGL
jgi:SAM-dependent methyltransferase